MAKERPSATSLTFVGRAVTMVTNTPGDFVTRLRQSISNVMDPLAKTPKPPYYAVVFTSVRTAGDSEGYAAMADRMVELASCQPGFLGIESARDDQGVGITVSYWSDLEAIGNWRDEAEHRVAQARGRTLWYREFRLRISRVERDVHYSCPQHAQPPSHSDDPCPKN